MVTAVKDTHFTEFKLIAPNQYKWSRKVWMDKDCDCPNKKSYWVYYIYEYADGCKFDSFQQEYGVVGPDEDGNNAYVIEEDIDGGRRKMFLTMEEEARNIDLNMQIPQSEQVANSLYFDATRGRKIGV